MKANSRSATGALLMLLIAPVIVGLLACMPVPIGNPERSRIDPAITGVWAFMEEDEIGGYYAFEPFDKRTWLLTGIPVDESDNEATLYKAWVTKLAGQWFMTWEPKAIFDGEDFDPEVWFVFKLKRPDDNTLDLHMVNGEHELFKEVEETRRAYERVIKKNIDNDELFDADFARMVRLTPEQREHFEDRAADIISFDL